MTYIHDLRELELLPCSVQASPPPTGPQVAVVERLVGKSLPEAYIAFLAHCNGCFTDKNGLTIETPWGQRSYLVAAFYTISADTKDTDDSGEIAWQYHHRGPDVPSGVVPIAMSPLGDDYSLDLRKDGGGRVLLAQHGLPAWASGNLPANTDLVIYVAPSFEVFLDLLAGPPEEE